MMLSIIIINWNTCDLLQKSIKCVLDDVIDLPFEVIVVDNGSTDDSVPVLKKNYPSVNVIENQKNGGFARAANQGIQAANGDYLLLLNTDAFVHAGAINRLWKAVESDPKIGVVGCKLYYADGKLQRSCFSFPTIKSEVWRFLSLDRLFPRNRVFGGYQMTYWDCDDERDVDYVMGACFLIRRSAIDESGLFDERFFMYSEEVDLCYRLRQLGWRVRFIPSAEATHLWGGSSRVAPIKSFIALHQSRILFFRKHYGFPSAWLLKSLYFLSGIIRGSAGYLLSIMTKRPEDRQKMANYFALSREVWKF